MKKHLLILATFIFTAIAHAQTGITNMDFEYWTGSVPDGYSGLGGITQETSGAQNGNSFARITINTPSSLTADGILALGTSVQAIGAPYTQRPYSISGFYRSHLAAPSDTMAIAVGLSLNNVDVATLAFTPICCEATGWTPITIPFNYANGNTPDTLFILFFANKYLITHGATVAGSYLDVDNFTIDMTAGIPSEPTHVSLSANPNPASGQTVITCSDVHSRHIQVYDVTGRLISMENFPASSVSINVSRFQNGIYIYKILDDKGEIVAHDRLIISN